MLGHVPRGRWRSRRLLIERGFSLPASFPQCPVLPLRPRRSLLRSASGYLAGISENFRSSSGLHASPSDTRPFFLVLVRISFSSAAHREQESESRKPLPVGGEKRKSFRLLVLKVSLDFPRLPPPWPGKIVIFSFLRTDWDWTMNVHLKKKTFFFFFFFSF